MLEAMDHTSVFEAAGGIAALLRLAACWAEVLGGPPSCTRVAAGHSAMLELHGRRQADDDLGMRVVDCFVRAVDDARPPDDGHRRAVLRANMEEAVRDVMPCPPTGSVVPADLPVPRWSRDGLATTSGSGG